MDHVTEAPVLVELFKCNFCNSLSEMSARLTNERDAERRTALETEEISTRFDPRADVAAGRTLSVGKQEGCAQSDRHCYSLVVYRL